jgi:DNA invertase Pin-like site-specific DNA recombinase
MNDRKKIRCAIYTRKSHEEGLEQEFNSLDAQREACLSYINSQRGEGWVAMHDHYDDGGFTGGNTERPALKRLFKDIEDGLIDVVVVYKIDRLSRSLLDFLTMVRLFDKHGVSFVSVTQQFNTSTPMGKLMLNVLMSFAEYEREVTGERIRDKIAASKAKGMWMGGVPPLGYGVQERKLLIIPEEAKIVRYIFERYIVLRSITQLIAELHAKGYKSKQYVQKDGKKCGAKKITMPILRAMLKNPIYIGQIRHKEAVYAGEHEAIISAETWEKVQSLFKIHYKQRPTMKAIQTPFILKGLIFDSGGRAMTPSVSQKKKIGKYYRYYVSTRAIKEGYAAAPVKPLNAQEIEGIVIAQARKMIAELEVAAKVQRILKESGKVKMTLQEVKWILSRFNSVWDELFPVEQNRLLRMLILRITVSPDNVEITYQPNGIAAVCQEMSVLQEIKESA